MRRYRRNFSAILASSDSNLTRNRFIRLFLTAFILIMIAFPIEILLLYKNSEATFSPYSWDRVHNPETWQNIMFIPIQGVIMYDRWIQVTVGFVVFLVFGLGPDAITMYRGVLVKLGFGKLSKCLMQDSSQRRRSFSGHSQASSRGSRARLFFTKTFKRVPVFSRCASFPSIHLPRAKIRSRRSKASISTDWSPRQDTTRTFPAPESVPSMPSPTATSYTTFRKTPPSGPREGRHSWITGLLLKAHVSVRTDEAPEFGQNEHDVENGFVGGPNTRLQTV